MGVAYACGVSDPTSVDDEASPASRGRRLRQSAQRRREQIRRRRTLDLTYRVVVFVVGGLIVLAGLAMLVLPGPGWLVIILGVAVLATEFAWAERLLARVKGWAERAKDAALDPKRRRRNKWLAGVGIVAVALSAWAYFARWGVALPTG
jgi:uncharacterized protein (TIGR02611 family)